MSYILKHKSYNTYLANDIQNDAQLKTISTYVIRHSCKLKDVSVQSKEQKKTSKIGPKKLKKQIHKKKTKRHTTNYCELR